MKKRYLGLIGLLTFGVAYAGLETATYINQLVSSNPTGTDHYSTADDHLRLLKQTLLNSFPNIGGAVTASHTELNIMDGVTSTTAELNLLDGITGTVWSSGNDGAASTLDADLLDGVQGSDYARISQPNTFTGGAQVISSTTPLFRLFDSNAGTNAKYTAFNGNSGFCINLEDDSALNPVSALCINRSGTTVSSIVLAATALTWNGNTLFTTANDGAASGLDADLLDGQQGSFYQSASNLNAGTIPDARVPASAVTQHQASLGVDTATASTIARRTSSGHLFAVNFNQGAAQDNSGPISNIFYENGSDGYLRKGSAATVGAALTTRNISGKGCTTKTLSTSGPSGGCDGDIWYRY